MAQERAPRVYISYSTHTPGQRQRVFAVAEQLRAAGIDARIDQYYARSLHGFVPPGAVVGDKRPPWTIWQQEQVEDADFVLVMCSPEYANASDGSGVWFDLSFMRDDMEHGSERSRKCIPAGFGPYAQLLPFAPDFLRDAHYHDLDEPSGVEDLGAPHRQRVRPATRAAARGRGVDTACLRAEDCPSVHTQRHLRQLQPPRSEMAQRVEDNAQPNDP